jgi:hypothetical protein
MYCRDGTFSEYIFSLIDRIVSDDFKKYNNAFELGAGMGRFSFLLVNNFPRIWLIEPSKAYALTIKKLFSNDCSANNVNHRGTVTIVNSTMEEFLKKNDIPERSIFFCFHLLHHLSYGQRKELYSCLAKTDAPTVFVEPNPWNPLIILQLMLYKDMRLKDEFQYLTFTKKKLSREFNMFGLTVETYDRLCFLPPPITKAILKLSFLKKPLLFFEKFRHVFPLLGSYQMFYCKSKNGKGVI